MIAYKYIAQGTDPYENLAIEEYFVQHMPEDAAVLYFWQNEDSVIFGRNQNAANECNLLLMQQWGVHPVRRKTGGGAVFHDIRNLNFSFIVPITYYDKEKSMQLVKDALTQLEIPAEINGRNDILLGESKISGNAYRCTEKRALHHGTLLLSVDMQKLEKLLTVDPVKLESKGIHSVRSRVCNLQDCYPHYTILDYQSALEEQFCHCYQQQDLQIFAPDRDAKICIQKLKQQYSTPEWIFGHDLEQVKSRTECFSWGNCTISTLHGKYGDTYTNFYSDTLYSEEFECAKLSFLNKTKDNKLTDLASKIKEDIGAFYQTTMHER